MREDHLTILSSEPQATARGPARNLKLALVSSGLGATTRGFEISTARWFDALREHTELDVQLYCGGNWDGGKKLSCFLRDSVWTQPFQWVPFLSEQRRWECGYVTEQLSFFCSLLMELISWKPDAVWVKDVPLAHMLLYARTVFGLNYKVILANGGMLRPTTYKDFDLIQQISSRSYDDALAFGLSPGKMQLITNCFPAINISTSKAQTRTALGINNDDWVIICVAAWNKYHKRIHYLLQEVARFEDPHVKLIVCGTPEVDAQELKELGAKLLGSRVHWLTVAPDMVPNLLNAADVFVLPSLRESLGNAIVEAALCGLPVIAHPHDGARFVLQDNYWMADLSQTGALFERLSSWKENPPSKDKVTALKASVSERFSSRKLAQMFERMVDGGCRR